MKVRTTVKWKSHVRGNVGKFKGVAVQIFTYAKIQLRSPALYHKGIKLVPNFGRKIDLLLP